MKKLMIYFAAGCLGGLVNSLAVWAGGNFGITQQLGVAIAPALTAHWLYPRIVWGGIWGLLFLLPMMDTKLFVKGSMLSLFPTIVQLFVIFPFLTKHGMAGMGLGTLTPVAVLAFNWIWGIATALAIQFSK